MDQTIVGLLLGSLTLFTSLVLISVVLIQKKLRRPSIWDTLKNNSPVTNSAPLSRRSSSSCLIDLEKPQQLLRSRSASFGEDLISRLQLLHVGNGYRSYAPVRIKSSPTHCNRASFSATTRCPTTQNASIQPTTLAITFQLRYESTIEILFVSVFQLQNYSSHKSNESVFLILYLLPNDDEQRQTRASTQGVFNEHFQFPLKSEDISNRILRLTAYTVNSHTRIRTVVGHAFIKLDQFAKDHSMDQSFSTMTLTEYLTSDLPMKSDQLGELVVTSCYLKDQNLLQIRIQEIHQLQLDRSNGPKLLKAHFSGRTSQACHRYQWINSSTFLVPQTSTFRIDQELNLIARSPPFTPIQDENVECHLRLHIHQCPNQIYGHARWSHSLRSSLPQTVTVSLRPS